METKRKPKNKIKFTMQMLPNGNLRSSTSKGANDFVSIEDCRDFISAAKGRLDELLERWEEMYGKKSREEHAP